MDTEVFVGDTPEALTGAALVATLDKDELEAYARDNFGRELDKRKKVETLRAEVLALISGETQAAEKVEAVAAEKAANPGTPKTVRHKLNGYEFPWNPLYAKNSDLEIIEWE